jgi:hypothetical protein
LIMQAAGQGWPEDRTMNQMDDFEQSTHNKDVSACRS